MAVLVEGVVERSPVVNSAAMHYPIAEQVADPMAAVAVQAEEKRTVGELGGRLGCIGYGLQGCILRRIESSEPGVRGIVAVVGNFHVGVARIGCSHLMADRKIAEATRTAGSVLSS